MLASNIVLPMDHKELQQVIRKAISQGQKIILKENIQFNKPSIDEETVIIDITNLNKIIDLDKENFTVTVEGGINFLELQTMLAEKGFYFPMDTYASAHTSLTYNVLHGLPSYTLGQYGNYREYVLGIEGVLFNGDYIKIGGKNIKNVSGLDIIGLMIGSKEALGIITSFTLRLLPLPEEKKVFICNFEYLRAALHTATHLNNTDIYPVRLQVINNPGPQLLKNKEIIKSPLIIAEIEGFKASMERKVDLFKSIVAQYATAPCQEITDPEQIKELWRNFREEQSQLLAKSLDTVEFSTFMSCLPEFIGELDREISNICPEHTIFVNALNSSGMIIPLQNVNREWHQIIDKTTQKYQANILGRKRFRDSGMNVIQERLYKAFDPANISFLGGEKYE